MLRSLNMIRVFRGPVTAALAFGLLSVSPVGATGNWCVDTGRTLLDTSNNCTSEPTRPRAFDARTFHWSNGSDYLMLNTGNELSIFKLDDPVSPQKVASSSFNFGTIGDRDYELTRFEVCDGCRYGVLHNNVKAMVIFDLGTASEPAFGGNGYRTFIDEASKSKMAMTYEVDGHQFLIANDVPSTCDGGSPIFVISGSGSAISIDQVGCVGTSTGGVEVVGGRHLASSAGTFLYLKDSTGQVYIFEVIENGANSQLEYRGSPAGLIARPGISIDSENLWLVVSDVVSETVSFWKIDGTDPSHVTLRDNLTISDVRRSSVSLRSPAAGAPATLWMAATGTAYTSEVFTFDGVSAPQPIAEGYWTAENRDENLLDGCGFENGGTLSPDGTALYLSWFVKSQTYDLSNCLDPTPAVASLEVTSQFDPVFPGDPVVVRNTSTGTYDRYAVWVTEEAEGITEPSGSGIVVEGDDLLVENPEDPVTFSGSLAIEHDKEYWANVEVDNSDPSLPPDLNKAYQKIDIDRAPTVTPTVEPDSFIKNETAALDVTDVEGHPSAYQWVVKDPSEQTRITYDQPDVAETIALDAVGTWKFELTATYPHENADGTGFYQYAAPPITREVGPVAASFTVAPDHPSNDASITFDGSSSRPADEIVEYKWEISGPSPAPCQTQGNVTCVINWNAANEAERIAPGDYSVTLTVRNKDDVWSSPVTKSVQVADSSIDPRIRWSSSPAEGAPIYFSIDVGEDPATGQPRLVQAASWDFGEEGCGVTGDQLQECNISVNYDCSVRTFTYGSGGVKQVNLTVMVDGTVYDAPTAFVNVTETGDGCGNTPPPSCNLTLNPTGTVVQSTGVEGATFAVIANSSDCSWSALSNKSWIRVTSGSSGTGTGTVRYEVLNNVTGDSRSGKITVGDRVFSVTQNAPSGPVLPANYVMSPTITPKIGQEMTFTADPALDIARWEFGETNCETRNTTRDTEIDCQVRNCSAVTWTFTTAGKKVVTMVLTDGRQSPADKGPTVRDVGQCCDAASSPRASFEMSTTEAYVGEPVDFTDTSAKSLAVPKVLTLSLDWVPGTPQAGQKVDFTINGLTNEKARAVWSFGGAGCDNPQGTYECGTYSTFPGSCQTAEFTYASAGPKNVHVDIWEDSVWIGQASSQLVVAEGGACGGGGGEPACEISLDPTESDDFGWEGGEGSFDVVADEGCEWRVTSSPYWVDITSGSQTTTGPGVVSYVVDENSTGARTGSIRVGVPAYTVHQQGAPDEPGDANSAPTAWSWTVSKATDEGYQSLFTRHEPSFTYAFEEPGAYRVDLVVENCRGESPRETHYLTVSEAPVEDFVVGAAVRTTGENETHWETDLRFFNPCGEPLDVQIKYEPEGINNTGADLVSREFQLGPGETRMFGNITEAFEGRLTGNELSGSVRIESSSESGCKVLSVSRTFTNTVSGSGTLGLFVPALPVKRAQHESLDLTGLVRNSAYRTNLRLVNFGDEDAWVPLTVFDSLGDEISESRSALVSGHSTKQINDIAGWLGVEGDLGPFSIRADVADLEVQAYATVVDNITGDSVLFMSSFSGNDRAWVVGLASNEGANESRWRTDVWLYNPTEQWIEGAGQFFVGNDPANDHELDWQNLKPHRVREYQNIVGDELGLDETTGYLVLTGTENGPAPQVAARTYNLDLGGGTYGLNLRTFTADDLLAPGDSGYIVGISNSAVRSEGFRTNLFLLNTDQEHWTTVRLTLIAVSGDTVGPPLEMQIRPGVLRQFDVAEKFGVEDVTGSASLEIEVIDGGAVAAYATEIDNRTQDAIFIPAQQLMMGSQK